VLAGSLGAVGLQPARPGTVLPHSGVPGPPSLRGNRSAAPPRGCWPVTSPVHPRQPSAHTCPGAPPPAGVGRRRAPRHPSQPDRRRGCSAFLHPPSGGVPGQACLQPCSPSTSPGCWAVTLRDGPWEPKRGPRG